MLIHSYAATSGNVCMGCYEWLGFAKGNWASGLVHKWFLESHLQKWHVAGTLQMANWIVGELR